LKFLKKMGMGIAAAALVVTPMAVSAPTAGAVETVSNGIAVTTNAVDAPGKDYCTLGAAGTDNSGNKVGVTAAHCFSHEADGAVIYKATGTNRAVRTPIGVISHRGTYVHPTPTGDARDWLVIKFDDDVNLTSNGPGARITSTAAPISSAVNGCKDGVTSGVTCGIVATYSPTHYTNFAWMDGGDSGGPFFVNNTQWAGINQARTQPFGPSKYLRADKIVADINAGTNAVGKGFVVANTP
jgi:hypothetical protein